MGNDVEFTALAGVWAARQTMVRMRRTASSSTASSRSPLRTASITALTRVGFGAGHLQVQPGLQRGHAVVDGPQSDDEALEAPFIP